MDGLESDPVPGLDHVGQQVVWDETHKFVERRAVIEQTKGMLMFVYGIDADAAFDLLRCHSQEHNTKLSAVAEQISNDLIELSRSKGPMRQVSFEGLMHRAHLRITRVAGRRRSVGR